jgi:heme/copper-type cytochrome/quinol oxidase subunit 2
MKRFLLFLSLILSLASAQAQTPEMADTMRSEGKIYVVVAILVIILLGVIAFLIFIDRKVSKIEKQLDNNKG